MLLGSISDRPSSSSSTSKLTSIHFPSSHLGIVTIAKSTGNSKKAKIVTLGTGNILYIKSQVYSTALL